MITVLVSEAKQGYCRDPGPRFVKHGRGRFLIPPASPAPETATFSFFTLFFFRFCASSAIAPHRPTLTSYTFLRSKTLSLQPWRQPPRSLQFHHTNPNITFLGEALLVIYTLFSHAWSSKVIEHRLYRSLLSPRNKCLDLSVLLPIAPPRASNTFRIRAIRLR